MKRSRSGSDSLWGQEAERGTSVGTKVSMLKCSHCWETVCVMCVLGVEAGRGPGESHNPTMASIQFNLPGSNF